MLSDRAPLLVMLLILWSWATSATPIGQLPLDAQVRPRTMVVTFDDLPYVAAGSASYVSDSLRATDAILNALRRHGTPAVAFVNESQLHATGEMDARIAVLQRWVDAGVILGNHTYSHVDFNTVTPVEFQEEVVRGEVITRRLMATRPSYQRYFRFPQTHTGDTADKKQVMEVFLITRGYRIAPHTIDNQDFVFNVPYSIARRSGDSATASRVRAAFLDFTLQTTDFAENITPQIFGRDIPQTLLLHVNDLVANTLDDLLTRFEQRAYRFVSLDEAMQDEAYQTTDTLVSRNGPTWLWRWMRSKGMRVSFAEEPEPPVWVSDLYRAHSR